MALKHTVQTLSGLSIDAYIRVAKANVEKEMILATVHIMANENELIPVEAVSYFFDHDLEGPNAIKQTYLYLKTLPEFDGAQDV